MCETLHIPNRLRHHCVSILDSSRIQSWRFTASAEVLRDMLAQAHKSPKFQVSKNIPEEQGESLTWLTLLRSSLVSCDQTVCVCTLMPSSSKSVLVKEAQPSTAGTTTSESCTDSPKQVSISRSSGPGSAQILEGKLQTPESSYLQQSYMHSDFAKSLQCRKAAFRNS